ncbi:acetyl-CoA carboxylase, carboxyl transferase, beta subunit [Thermobaculum terrenum ATCC BAA-798]|uniref:Acetyl-coenzyme A carboxylase carboxyl transferase subunit beta n=1 Tax=Thermobaculum terrenum (strain ATCC BAA-798 / CCMEE 7001 / YNP1) TaxID=525904 RepID=D1CD37_THET1|nr:acetyl-CoA carboxylase, carboxyltransferase subunit beta [Thermobaculum terrenum]ACZ42702.1 acetyl-CoA carboxylase, carboxyl transferase, beta subunit [Thermobaculum terrenum ATCC BAA-798]
MRDFFRRHSPTFHPAQENRDIPDDLWVKCTKCKELLYHRELENNEMVCPRCGHHFRLRVHQRVRYLVDEGSFEEQFACIFPDDPLGFEANGETYLGKVREKQRETGIADAMVVGTAKIEGHPLVLAVSDFSFMGASMGSVYGEKLVRAVGLALQRQLPILTVSSSGGARMQEGIFSLMQMAKTVAAFAELGRRGLPHISLLTDPCFGGVTASYAMTADVILAEPKALIGFAGPRVIEQITRQKLPPGFQTAEFCLEHGMIDMVVPRRDLRPVIGNLLTIFDREGS